MQWQLYTVQYSQGRSRSQTKIWFLTTIKPGFYHALLCEKATVSKQRSCIKVWYQNSFEDNRRLRDEAHATGKSFEYFCKNNAFLCLNFGNLRRE